MAVEPAKRRGARLGPLLLVLLAALALAEAGLVLRFMGSYKWGDEARAATASAGASPVFVDSAIFERLEHFKDIGVPATLQDPIARAAIADGTCRLVVPPGSGPFPLDGYDFWHHNPERVNSVLKALAELPSSSQPSKFVRAATRTSKLELYEPSALAKTLSNWHRVLCDPNCDDPAEEPQQQALTTGFICMAVCDTAKMKLTSAAMGSNPALQTSWKQASPRSPCFAEASDD
ncbi:hypothetical protein AK812_SmicGene24367 [Symbiodinium microadriaticum]|uniref:Uncharacterized protein n=1 Tax=Symbiodinium microadriaticum TaxID=2951 RepID=A0A1Q9DET0_SYMMI|nr:hypothetical protein AK812_SmicGene24367 [Symbiodinium microadriaticum]